MKQYNNQGITENYPQYTTNFWGSSADNNYGFGTSNIGSNIENMQATNQPQQTSNDPNCYMTFDGQNLGLYKYGQYDGNRLVNGQLQYNLDGQSGGDDYQSRIHQDVPNKGPIPEGTYYADQDQRQNITALDAVAGIVGHGKWAGSLPAWGTSRVWLRPDDNTNTYGRSGFSIHGGLTKGSAGCIDIPYRSNFANLVIYQSRSLYRQSKARNYNTEFTFSVGNE
jgi:hypothetical protein